MQPYAGCAASAAQPARLSDLNGIWDRDVVREGPNHFDPNVAEADQQKPPLNDAYMQIWKAHYAQSIKGDLSYDTSIKCFPKGFPRVMMAPYGLEILATPEQVNMFNEASQETVRVFLDGKSEIKDHDPTYIGFTTGRWANGVLTTRTTNLRADTIFDVSGIPHSDALTVTQRFRFLDKNTLEDVVTSSDPKAFTHDWVVRMVFRRQPRSRYANELVCEENNRDSARTGPPK